MFPRNLKLCFLGHVDNGSYGRNISGSIYVAEIWDLHCFGSDYLSSKFRLGQHIIRSGNLRTYCGQSSRWSLSGTLQNSYSSELFEFLKK